MELEKIEKIENSDMSDRIMDFPLLNIFHLIYHKYKEQLLYLFFGALTTLVSIVTFMIVESMGIPTLISNIISWIFAVLFAYGTNRTWVFRSESVNIMSELCEFAGGRLFTLFMEEIILLVGVTLLNLNSLFIKIIAQVFVLVGNYIISKFIVFC